MSKALGQWSLVPFDEALEVLSDDGKRLPQSDYLVAGDLPVVDQGEGLIGGYTGRKDLLFTRPLPVIVFGDHTRRFKIVTFPFVVGAQGVKLLQPRSGWNEKFLLYALQVAELPNRGYSRHFQFLRKISLPHPPRQTQDRIVAEIEKQLTRLDTGIQALKRLRVHLRRYRAAVLAAAFDGTLSSRWRPASWGSQSLGDLIGAGGVFTDGDWVESKDQDPAGDVRLIQLADVGDGVYRDRSDRFLASEKAAELRTTFLSLGDVLVARMPDPLGRACIFPGDEKKAVTVVDVCIIRPGSSGPDSKWLCHAINSPQVRAQIAALQAGTTRKRISRKNLATVMLRIPGRQEQADVAREVDARLSQMDAVDAQITATLTRASRLRVSMLRAACSGSLVRNEEPSRA